ncbi:hypothetical protein ACFYWU_36020 [Streptomyces chrestomyceticus]|uniref:hypothetical protein n=1 Tax=Streptomyces chrestomyceticus TaxID=68185 RepID=UPI003682724F
MSAPLSEAWIQFALVEQDDLVTQGIVTAIIGLTGAVVGAGATSLTTWLGLRHQRRSAREARLYEVGHVATDTALAKLIELQDLTAAAASSSSASRDDREPWEEAAHGYFREVELALLRIPNDEVHDRVKPTLDLAKQYRYAGPRHFHYLRHVRQMTQDMIDALSAYIRGAELPPPSQDVTAAQQKVETAREAERHRDARMYREWEELRAEEPAEPDDLP